LGEGLGARLKTNRLVGMFLPANDCTVNGCRLTI
jgi:hypothetical protein